MAITKALNVIMKEKIDCHSRIQMEVSQLGGRRNDEIKRKFEAARRKAAEEKHQKTRAKASKMK